MNERHDILLVEDSASDALLVREALRTAHVKNALHVVESSDQALAFLNNDQALNPESIKPGLILVDLYMPGMSGQDLIKVIKSNPDYMMIPVIVMTSSRDEQDIKQAYRSLANGYIVKPVDFNKLVDVMKAIESFWLNIVELP